MRHYLVPYNRRGEDDPLFDEYTYGHQQSRLNKVEIGEYLFFYTKILDKKYITAYYEVFDKKSVKEIRNNPLIAHKYKNHHISNGKETDIVIFGHPVYSFILDKPLLLNNELIEKIIGDKEMKQSKLILKRGSKSLLLNLIHNQQQTPLHNVSLTTEDIYHLREYDIENFLANNPKLLDSKYKFVERQKVFSDMKRLDLLLKDDNGFVIVEIKKGLIDQDVYSQIKGYINLLRKEEQTLDVRGIIVCRGFVSEQAKSFYTEKIQNGKIEIFLHAWKFDLKKISELELINV